MRRQWPAILLLGLMGLSATAGVATASPADDDRLLTGLRQRRLYTLAESFCRQQLQRSGLSDRRRAELAIELAQTCSDHALQSTGPVRERLWQQALAAAHDFIRQEPTSPRLVLVQVQLAVLETRQSQTLIDEHESGAAIALEPIRELLREAIGQLQSAGREVSEQLRRKRQGEVSGPGMLTADELVALERHVQFELASALLAQARSYPAGSPDRVSSATQADEILTPLAGRDQADALVWASRLARITAARLSGDIDSARSRLQSLADAQPPVEILAQVWAELVGVQLDAGHVDEALKMVESHASDKLRSPQWHYAVLSTYLAAWRRASQQAGDADQARRAQAWQAKAAKETESIERDFGPPWSRRAEMLVAGAAAHSPGTGQSAVLVKAAETFFRAGRTDEALAAYDRAQSQATHDGQPQAAFDAGLTAAAIEHEQKHYAEASRRFRALSLEFPKQAKAAEAHLLAAFNMAHLAGASHAKSIDDYAAVLDEQVQHWPQAPCTDTARLWLGKLDESRRQWERAIAAYRAIPASSPQHAPAVEAIGRCWSAWLDQRQTAGEDTAELARAAGDYFYALVAPGGRWPLEWSASQRAAALAAARIWLEYKGDRFAQAEELIRRVPAEDSRTVSTWQQQSSPLLALALAGQGRRREAGELISKLSAAADESGSMQILADGLVRLAQAAADPARRELGELALTVCENLVRRSGGLSDAQRQSMGLVRAQALVATGRTADARHYLTSLVHDFPRDPKVREQYAAILSDASDAADLHVALDQWRALEQANRPGSQSWFRAKYGLALTHSRLGNHQRAARIIELTQVLHPDLGGTKLKAQFMALLDRCRQSATPAKEK